METQLRTGTIRPTDFKKEWSQYTQRSKALYRLLHPARIAIAGRSNAGKSTLFNSLLKQDRSIVSSQPGTTIDSVTAMTSMAQLPVLLMDTPGQHNRAKHVEQTGIQLSSHFISEADLILYLISSEEGFMQEDMDFLEKNNKTKIILLTSKSDIRNTVHTVKSVQRNHLTTLAISTHNPTQSEQLKETICHYLCHGIYFPVDSAALFHKNKIQQMQQACFDDIGNESNTISWIKTIQSIQQT